MPQNNTPITFLVPGQSGPAPAPQAMRGGTPYGPALPGQVKQSVRVQSLRDGGAPVSVSAVPGQDIVALHIDNGPVLLLHPSTARDLLLGPNAAQRGAGDAVPVAAQLHWPGADDGAATRDLAGIGSALITAFQVLTGLGGDDAADFAASKVVQHVDGQVDAGVYLLQPNRLDKLKGSAVAQIAPHPGPLLVLVHGTFVETTSTFGKLWLAHRASVDRLFEHYGGAVYALDHPTLGASPIANARTLVQALPDGARLHLVTHSRGGLVAEVLARVAGQGGVGAADLAFFNDPAYAGQRDELRELGALVAAKRVQVDRVVRVACPARGTLLASHRLDAYLSVLKWMLEATGLVIAPALLDFIGEVARRRAEPGMIPGLAAMIPGAPVLNWLNAAPAPIPGDLRVVAGDLQHGNSVGSWVKALLADAYYWTDNDIVVQTRSMYGGAPRRGGASFLLDQGPNATHFNYFINDKTADGVVDALLLAQPPVGFKPIGPLSWAGEDASGERAALRSADDPSRPAVFVLPGILGSNLKQGLPPDDERIWLSLQLLGNFSRLAYAPGGADQVCEDGPIGAVYGALIAQLQSTHEVIPFGYDWRRPLEEEAARLATRVRQALDARQASGQPVRLLAHSMGGLLARTMQVLEPALWQRLFAHPKARLLMLGTPNGGSWAPMQVLSGDDPFGNALAAFGSPFGNHQARMQMAAMPGFLQLQAGLLDPAQGLGNTATWQKLADDDYATEEQKNWWRRYANETMVAVYRWGVPPQAVLDQAKALRARLDAQLTGPLQGSGNQVLLVVGQAHFTPDGYVVDGDGFAYLNAQDGGDGRVPLHSALLPGVPTWCVDSEHGALPSTTSAFAAYGELLELGHTGLLNALPAERSAAAPPVRVRSRPSRRPPQAAADALFGHAVAGEADNTPPALHISVLNGNLTFVQQPLLLGHYRSLQLTGTEAVVNKHLGGAMQHALEAGLYPDAPGSAMIFMNTRADADNPWRLPRPRAAVVIGLGEEGTINALGLEQAVCQGVKAWSQRAAESDAVHTPLELAATLLGSGGIGITAGSAARAIARGVRLANQRLAGSGWPTVAKLTLVELYLDRATEAWRGLNVLAKASPGAFDVASTIASGTGPLRRQPESGYRGADYDLISASTAADNAIAFALDTRRARTEVRAQHTQPQLVRKLVERAATHGNRDLTLGRTLFQLLVPLELKPFLSGTDRVLLQLDDGTTPIPWELLDTRADDIPGQAPATEPWSIRTRLLRKLATSNFRHAPRDANADDAVLVIGEPLVDDPRYPALPGARSEAVAVAQQLQGPGGLGALVTALVDQDPFDTIINELMARPYRIVHVAGHGAPVQRDATGKVLSRGGVVLSSGVFLGPDELATLPVVPELVFINCCHLGGHEAAQTLQTPEPAAFAAGVADALINIGVRCVVAAGWAVDDRPAELFATRLYASLLAGLPFVDAVAAARKAARDAAPGSNTWAAYQCYGDANWVFRTGTGDAQGVQHPAQDDTEGIASAAGLALTLEEMAVRARFALPADAEAATAQQRTAQATLQRLAERYAHDWGGMGAVAEAFGVAWDACGAQDQAITWYERAVAADDASASLRAPEQLGNLRARRAWAQATTVDLKDAQAVATARHAITEALRGLQTLTALSPTVERHSLCGSAWKRLCMLETRVGDNQAADASLAMAIAAYRAAEDLALATRAADLHYPALNRIVLEVASGTALQAADLQRVAQSLAAKVGQDPDFWSLAGQVELQLYTSVARGELARSVEALLQQFEQLHQRVPFARMWSSVSDQADFCLGRRSPGAAAAEQQAMRQVCQRLRAYAGPMASTDGHGPGAGRPS